MNEVAKARHFLKQRNSNLMNQPTFQAMLVGARKVYHDIELNKQNIIQDGNYEQIEFDNLLNLAVLSYLKKNSKLPAELPTMLDRTIPLEDRRKTVQGWLL